MGEDESAQTPQFRRLKPRTGKTIGFVLDGHPAEAAEGDTLLTAMLLNGGFVRRFEFGDGYRAGFCLMGACQDCWVLLTDGRRQRACTTHVTEGIAVITEVRPHV